MIDSERLPEDAEGRVRRMLGSLRHRGPDQFGLFVGRRVVLGSARLSILDLAGGQQPMVTADQRHWIVFNGEIFNYLELRGLLESRGSRFSTHSDTEVLLHLLALEGPAGLHRLNGQFAAAVYDSLTGELLLVRDRLGVRPLFFTRRGQGIYFGSEIKALLAGTGERAQLDPAGIGEVFTYWSPLPGHTVFDGIHEVPAGHWLRWSAGRTELRRYWDPAFGAGSPGGPDRLPERWEECQEALADHLLSATRIRLRADVPVGAYLSGGLDSSLLAAMVRGVHTAPLRTFSIAFTDTRFDERSHQERMASFLGTDHEVVEATHADIGRVFPEVVRHTETPVLRTAPAPMFLLSQRVRDRGFKVVLTGEGADEFLGGYDIFKEAAVRRFWARAPQSTRRPALLGRLYEDVFAGGSPAPGMVRAFFGQGLGEVDDPAYSHAIRWRNTRRLWRFFSQDIEAQLADRTPSEAVSGLLPADFSQWHPLERAQYLEIKLFLSQHLLSSQGDRVAMAHSVEGRHPFLDFRLVEWCHRLPPGFKLRALQDKRLLRAVGKRFLPPEIWQRPKRPYRAPIAQSFFHTKSPDYVHELLSESSIHRSGLFKSRAVSALHHRAASGVTLSETDEMALAGILSTQLAHHWFVAQSTHADPVGGPDDVKVCREAEVGGRGPAASGQRSVVGSR